MNSPADWDDGTKKVAAKFVGGKSDSAVVYGSQTLKDAAHLIAVFKHVRKTQGHLKFKFRNEALPYMREFLRLTNRGALPLRQSELLNLAAVAHGGTWGSELNRNYVLRVNPNLTDHQLGSLADELLPQLQTVEILRMV